MYVITHTYIYICVCVYILYIHPYINICLYLQKYNDHRHISPVSNMTAFNILNAPIVTVAS